MTDSQGVVENLITAYLNAKQSVIELGYGHEIDWMASSAERIVSKRKACRKNALRFFNSVPKIDAIIQIATHVHEKGFWSVHESIKQRGPAYLRQLPYMGPATSLHLAKNLGFQEVKPDRHLTRLAAALGYTRPMSMCAEIAAIVGDKLSVVDLIIWRYATLHRNYVDAFEHPTPNKPLA